MARENRGENKDDLPSSVIKITAFGNFRFRGENKSHVRSSILDNGAHLRKRGTSQHLHGTSRWRRAEGRVRFDVDLPETITRVLREQGTRGPTSVDEALVDSVHAVCVVRV